MGEKVKKLKDAGLVKEGLPKAYEDVIEGMDPNEVTAVLNLKKRFDEAKKKAPEAGDYALFMAPPF